jgi:DNA-binding transcriptional MerR regulator
MYSIGEVSRLTGITVFTLRYYEKIGLIPNPCRQDGKHNGKRQYNESEVQFIRFINGLKQTGMKLEEIGKFAEDGCLLTKKDVNISGSLSMRIDVLEQHIENLEQQIKQMETVLDISRQKRNIYCTLLQQKNPRTKDM